MSDTLERQARTVGGNRDLLHRHLDIAKTILLPNEYPSRYDFKEYFKPGRFEFDNKRLVSECGTYALQWSVREDPKSPISYENQQTSVGSVKLVRL